MDMISDNDRTETFSIDSGETQTFDPETDQAENPAGQNNYTKSKTPAEQNNLTKAQTPSPQSSNGLCSGIGNKEVKKEEIRKKLKYMEHVLDIEN
jgi:hypothetical protein